MLLGRARKKAKSARTEVATRHPCGSAGPLQSRDLSESCLQAFVNAMNDLCQALCAPPIVLVCVVKSTLRYRAGRRYRPGRVSGASGTSYRLTETSLVTASSTLNGGLARKSSMYLQQHLILCVTAAPTQPFENVQTSKARSEHCPCGSTTLKITGH